MNKIKNSSNAQAGIQGIYISAPVKEKPPSGVEPSGGISHGSYRYSISFISTAGTSSR